MEQTAALGTTTAINTAGTIGGNWANGNQNNNIPTTLVGSGVGYGIGWALGKTLPPIGSNIASSLFQEALNAYFDNNRSDGGKK